MATHRTSVAIITGVLVRTRRPLAHRFATSYAVATSAQS